MYLIFPSYLMPWIICIYIYKYILKNASYMYILQGVAVIMMFADGLIQTITKVGNLMNIRPFFISMVITPVASNASELISSIIFSSAKRKKNTSLLFSALYGGVAMNNALNFGTFLLLLWMKNLQWKFPAETFSLLFVTFFVGLIGMMNITLRVWYVIPVVLCFPFSVILVYFLQIVFKQT